MHEIVTLQFGSQSNYLGTHFWNTQESYFTYPPEPESAVDHDIHFRAGVAPDGSDTFTPRALIYDLKGAFGSMRKINALYEAEDDRSILDQTGVWPSKPIVQRAQPIPQSTYQQHLDAGLEPPQLSTSTVKYWSDYSRVYYHPKSIVQLSEFDVNDRLMPFQSWDVGMDLFEKLEREVDLVDRDLRFFVEECDGLQGLQIMTGVDDAWGGWASGWIERLRDEYGKLSIWTWGLGDQGANTTVPRASKRLQQIVNSSRSLQPLAEQSSVYIPVSNRPTKVPDYLSFDATSAWQVSALQAAGVESMTISSRLRTSNGRHGTLQDIEDTINSTGKRRIAKFEMSIADPDVLSEKTTEGIARAEKAGSTTLRRTSESETQLSSFDIDAFSKDYRLASSKGSKKEHIFARAEACRGAWSLSDDAGRNPRDKFGDGPGVKKYTTPLLFPVLDSYPSIFDVGSGHTEKLAVHAGLTTSTAVAEQVRAIEQIVKRLVAVDEREALCNGLQVVAEEYDEGWDGDFTDSDDDD
ncbi:protein DML1 [Macroventuria anomochaeta]|uniref:Protein DML1 n=1 Tax=Macroventuria anomochaeta TaxID=301207 RepID=A0ACB6RSW2_9PLEO|nr:protein DML1 [Macroventuria anomochaeta]KAF2624888.1 protein DML1 [Macroventuria anomochaeta]